MRPIRFVDSPRPSVYARDVKDRPRVMWFLSGLACTDVPADTPQVTPWVYEEPTEGTEALSPEVLAAALPVVVGALRRVDPGLTHAAYLDALGSFDTTCPTESDHNGQRLREGTCTAASGARYYGYELHTHLRDMYVDFPGASGFQNDFQWMTGNSRLELPDGTAVVLGGGSLVSDRTDDANVPRFSVYLWGAFRREGAAQVTDWLDEDLGVEVMLEASGPLGGRVVTWDGGITGLAGDIVAFRLDDLARDTTSSCASPTGGLALYGRDGRWVDVDFGDTCDGCADIVRDGSVVTRACADWSPLFDWTRSPWE
jgi:hypothetical protein